MARSRLEVLDVPDVAAVHGAADLPASRIPRVFSTAPCAACAGTCCKGARVEVTTVEALRIAFGAGLGLEAVVQRVDCPPSMARRMAAVPIPLDDGLTVLRLRHAREGGCVFLQRVLEQGRCAVHAHRPALCHFYPFRFRAGAATVQAGDESLCPSRWMKSSALEDELAAIHRRWRRDVVEERRLVRAWKAAGGEKHPWNEYSAFALRHVTGRLGWTLPTTVLVPARRFHWR